ncbi:MAG TPA: hypothetical protein VFI98_07145 [Pseudolabrys sp.]|jgi:hypothetical protein|nr:hypothetical protein [Pseudolabrys sp.]
MRKLLIVTGLAAMIASPAMAQSYSAGVGTGNVVNLPALEHGGFTSPGAANAAFASAPEREITRGVRNGRAQAPSSNDPDTVYESGQYVGRDPDPNVRLELRRDWTHD